MEKSSQVKIPHASTSNGFGNLVRARDISTRLGLHPKTLRRWADSGLITRFKINSRLVFFDETEVLQFVQRARVSKPAQIEAGNGNTISDVRP